MSHKLLVPGGTAGGSWVASTLPWHNILVEDDESKSVITITITIDLHLEKLPLDS